MSQIGKVTTVQSICKIDGCNGMVKAKGLCNGHYIRQLRFGDPLIGGELRKTSSRTPRPFGSPCKFDGCDGVTSPGSGFGFCVAHYMRYKKGADMSKPINRLGRKEKRIDKNGYVCWSDQNSPYKSNSSGLVLEHRHVMSELLGRPLLSHENVHHKNGDRSDNHPLNLELWDTSQPSGQRVEDKVTWAITFLRRHGFLVTAESTILKQLREMGGGWHPIDDGMWHDAEIELENLRLISKIN